jgi:hypothetical protein
MYLDQDPYGIFAKCLQCGRIYESNHGQSKLVALDSKLSAQAGSKRLAA